MEKIAVAAPAILGMILSILLTFGVPIVMMGITKGKLEGQFRSGLLGFVMYIAPAGLVIVVIRAVLSAATGGAIARNPFGYGILMALPSALGCVLTKYLVIRSSHKLENNFGQSFMYGIGFAMSAGVLRYGFRETVTLMTALSINRGTAGELMNIAKENNITTVEDSLKAITESGFTDHFVPGMSNVLLMVIDVAITVIIYLGIRYQKKQLIPAMLCLAFMIELVYYFMVNMLGNVAGLVVVSFLTVFMLGLDMALWKKYAVEE